MRAGGVLAERRLPSAHTARERSPQTAEQVHEQLAAAGAHQPTDAEHLALRGARS